MDMQTNPKAGTPTQRNEMMKIEIKLIALDLDGTLLNSMKELPERNYRALEAAAASGIQIVPCTGRLFAAMPGPVRELPFVRYAICANGAQVVDKRTWETFIRREIPHETGMRVFDALDAYPGLYDCYMDGIGWMGAEMRDRFSEFVSSERTLHFLRSVRTPVRDFKMFTAGAGRDFQKIQIFFHSPEERLAQQPKLQKQFPELLMTSSGSNNIEINAPGVSKGAAVTALCELLGFTAENAMCFGDGSNDASMLKAAGCGVAMENALEPIVKASADMVAPPADECGVAQVIERLLRGEL